MKRPIRLSLGPSRDTAKVLIEIRAAEIADLRRMHPYPSSTQSDHEILGWSAHVFNDTPKRAQLAGWLAREIWMAR